MNNPNTGNLLTDLTVGEALALLVTLTTLIGALIAVLRAVLPLVHRLNNLTDDWFGEEARAGVPARLGVMQRLENQDRALASLHARLGPLDTPDVPIQVRLTAIESRVEGNNHRIRALDKLLRRHMRESEAWVLAVTDKAGEREFQVPPWPRYIEDDPEQG